MTDQSIWGTVAAGTTLADRVIRALRSCQEAGYEPVEVRLSETDWAMPSPPIRPHGIEVTLSAAESGVVGWRSRDGSGAEAWFPIA